MRLESTKIVIDWVAFLLVTIDLYGEENLKQLTRRLSTPLILAKDLLVSMLAPKDLSEALLRILFGFFRQYYTPAPSDRAKESKAISGVTVIGSPRMNVWQSTKENLIGAVAGLLTLLSGSRFLLIVACFLALVYTTLVGALPILKIRGAKGFIVFTGAMLFTAEKLAEWATLHGWIVSTSSFWPETAVSDIAVKMLE